MACGRITTPSKPLGEHTISVPQLGLSRGLIYPPSHIKQQIRVFQLLAHSSKSNESRFYVDAVHVCFVMRDDARIMNDMNRSYDEHSARRLPGECAMGIKISHWPVCHKYQDFTAFKYNNHKYQVSTPRFTPEESFQTSGAPSPLFPER